MSLDFKVGEFWAARDSKRRVFEVLEIISKDHAGVSFLARPWVLGNGKAYLITDIQLFCFVLYAEKHYIKLDYEQMIEGRIRENN